MKKTTIILLTLFTLIGCSNTINVDNSKQIAEQQLRSDFKNGNFKALSTLITDYQYPTSKNDIKEVERIYQSINDKDSLKNLLDFIKAYNVIKEIFINGRVKYNKLLNLALKKNSQEARFIAITYYIERNNAVLIDKVEEDYIREASQEGLTRLLALYKKHQKSLKEKNLIGIMKKKGFSIPQKQDLSACLHNFKESKKLDDILDDICAKNNIDYIYQTAKYSKSSKHTVTLLKKILTLNPTNELREKVYNYIYETALYSKSITLLKEILTSNPTNKLRGKFYNRLAELSNSNQIVEQQLRSDFKNGNLKALSTLITDYQYPTSKNDIKEVERIYQSINDKDSLQDLLDFIKAYNVIKEIFINGHVKYNKLLNLALKKNSQEARFIAITYYIERNNAVLIDKVEEDYIREASQEGLARLLALYKKHQKSLKEKSLIGIMKNKGFSIPQKQDLSACLHNFKGSKKLDDILDDICAKNNIDYIYQTAIDSKSSKHTVTLLKKILTLSPTNELREKVYNYIYQTALYSESITLLKKILTLDPTNELRGKVYARLAELSLTFTRGLFYKRKATLLHNKEVAMRTLDYYYKHDYYDDDSHQFQTLKDKLLKTDEGKEIIARFYYGKRNYKHNRSYAYYLWEQLAVKGDDTFIIKLASLNFKSYLDDDLGPDDYEKNLLANKWQDYIIKSNDIALLQKTKLLIKKQYGSRTPAKLFLRQLNNVLPEKEDILTLRDVYHANTRNEEGLKALKKAIDLGDVQSRYELANIYLNKNRSSAKGIKILKNLTNEGDAKSAYRLANMLYPSPNIVSRKERLNAIEQSIKYFKIASSLGSYNATSNLANLYLCKSCYSETNFKKSLFYWQKYVSDIKGYDDFGIGWIYNTGDKTVAQDIKKAEEHYLKASRLGYKAAYENLILLYYGEDALNINNKKAFDYARIGSEHGDQYSTYMLAQFYDEGLGVQQDKKQALAYYLTLLRSKTFTDDFEDLPEKIGNIYMALNDYSNAKKYLQNKE